MTAALLGVEQSAQEEAQRRGHEVSGWEPYSTDERASLVRTLFAATASYSLLATCSLAARTPRAGQCAALRERPGPAHEVRFYAERVLPERYAELSRALQVAPCRLRRPRLAWESNALEGQYRCDDGYDSERVCRFSPAVMALPFFDEAFGNILADVVSRPDPFRRYDAFLE